MSYCYAEKTKEGQVKHLVFQDETGVYDYVLNKDGGKFIQTYMLWCTNTKDFREFARRFERNYYMETIPTEIREYEGTREEVVQAAMTDFSRKQ